MGRKAKIDLKKLEDLLLNGKGPLECSKYFKVSPSAITQAMKKNRLDVTKHTSLENAPVVASKWLSAVDQLQKINHEANKLLDDIEQDPNIRVRAMAEIRGQLKLQLEIMQALYDVRAAEEFQKEVLEAIREVAPDVRDRILQRLHKRRAIRQAVVRSGGNI